MVAHCLSPFVIKFPLKAGAQSRKIGHKSKLSFGRSCINFWAIWSHRFMWKRHKDAKSKETVPCCVQYTLQTDPPQIWKFHFVTATASLVT
ncbi:hypothetical protein QG37_04435 [Candidozyma auris]|nr:hypothetical protein QG37_04435 [[Candida] auris]